MSYSKNKTFSRSAKSVALREVKTLDSQQILQGNKLILIEHDDKTYQLRVTKENKLILTK